jgi:uncharacterized protein
MQALLRHVINGIVSTPAAVEIRETEGEASVVYELTVADADLDSVRGPDGETLRAIRTVLSASSGDRRAVLELVEPGAEASADG